MMNQSEMASAILDQGWARILTLLRLGGATGKHTAPVVL